MTSEQTVRQWNDFLTTEIGGNLTDEQRMKIRDIATKLAICETEGLPLDFERHTRPDEQVPEAVISGVAPVSLKHQVQRVLNSRSPLVIEKCRYRKAHHDLLLTIELDVRAGRDRFCHTLTVSRTTATLAVIDELVSALTDRSRLYGR